MAEIARPDRFRILIIGRANAGKTTILRAVCGAEGEPNVYDQDGNEVHDFVASQSDILCTHAFLQRGEHNIEYSLMFPNSPGFVFHDSRGFESGAVEELALVREFIRKKANLGSMQNQLHAIWYCFSTDSNRFMTAAEKEFFDTIDTGTVPVIAIFTKFDALDAAAFSALSEQGVPFAEAQRRAPVHAQAQFNQGLLPLIQQLAHPPRAVVCLRSKVSILRAASELIEGTGATLDGGALKVLLVQAQCVNVELCMKGAVDR
ncbi:hypothetical protein BOTBODRAFT_111351 [Botryobasidium botryosum FD-172 SS1]|uniref:Uncharacterized protein n=1 Tax=Botryobasidium botryosum (strain FD-172 SS1) TaxID=930990 RepID=A0A067MDC7_BOTB1|nr:hypothetical protein BOTBODRAFT_111351 [Botryobasidium botryosum FD-172 SS1]